MQDSVKLWHAGKQSHLWTASASIDLAAVSCPAVLAPAAPLPLHLDVIKGAYAFVNCGGMSGETVKRPGRLRQDKEAASNSLKTLLTEVEVEPQQVKQHQQRYDAQHDRHKGQYKEAGWRGL